MKRIQFPEADYLENLVLQEDRDTYAAMTPAQRRLVRFAFYYAVCQKEETR